MIKIENAEVHGWEAAIRGMRSPMNSWEKSDSKWCDIGKGVFEVGENDLKLMKQLVKAGTDHAKFMRMITVTLDIIAPMYWWKEFDTYKVATVRNSCSTMHTIHKKEFTLDDFSHEHILFWDYEGEGDTTFKETFDHEEYICTSQSVLDHIITALNHYRKQYIETKDKEYWWQIIQLLPQSYNQRATVQLNYQVLRNTYHARKNHKLDEWRSFCEWVKDELPYSNLITYDNTSIEQGMTITGIEEALNEMPNIQSKQKTGQWLINSDGYYPYCSICKNEPQNRVMTKYCPNCGAKMEE